jgi:chaperone BCS1
MAPLYYTPRCGQSFCFFKGRFIAVNRYEDRIRDAIFLTCLGRDPQILKDLLQEAREQYFAKDDRKTVIYRAIRHSRSFHWTRSMARVSRPLSTVVLDASQKNAIIDDIKEYLHPATRRYYETWGIPYRRGYLFHGPPGTGKASLSFALAGIFGLRIYVVSFNSSLNEDALSSLFAYLPRRCIVLLEDIDIAGIPKRGKEKNIVADDSDAEDSAGNVDNGGTAKGPVNQEKDLPGKTSSKVSLSALLNVIDGVASQEGRILLMTTNHIERLDDALIRPGRVDKTIKFGYATEETTALLFQAIFAPSKLAIRLRKPQNPRRLRVRAGFRVLNQSPQLCL